jgi:hypothetical protein
VAVAVAEFVVYMSAHIVAAVELVGMVGTVDMVDNSFKV